MPTPSFDGLSVLALESRRCREIAKLIENLGGMAVVAPSVKEVALDSNQEALNFARALMAHEVDVVIFTTGVGVKALASAVEDVCSREALCRHLKDVVVVARGPKPSAALRELGVQSDFIVPEPNTWRDLLTLLDENKNSFSLVGRRVVIQEYGVTNPDLSAGLSERGAIVTPVNVYQWALPDDLSPLEDAIESVIRGDLHVILVMSSVQIRHLFQVAERMGKAQLLHSALLRMVIGSIGPLTSEELRSRGLTVDIESSHPKMGFLVKEAAERAPQLLGAKRTHGNPLQI